MKDEIWRRVVFEVYLGAPPQTALDRAIGIISKNRPLEALAVGPALMQKMHHRADLLRSALCDPGCSEAVARVRKELTATGWGKTESWRPG